MKEVPSISSQLFFVITSTKTIVSIQWLYSYVILADQINLVKKRNRKVRCVEHFVTLIFTPKVTFEIQWSNYRPKRSFGQGNIFTPVCHSVHGGGAPDIALIWGGAPPNFRRGGSSKFSGGVLQIFGGGGIFLGGGSPPEYGQRSAGTHPTGMHSC